MKFYQVVVHFDGVKNLKKILLVLSASFMLSVMKVVLNIPSKGNIIGQVEFFMTLTFQNLMEWSFRVVGIMLSGGF